MTYQIHALAVVYKGVRRISWVSCAGPHPRVGHTLGNQYLRYLMCQPPYVVSPHIGFVIIQHTLLTLPILLHICHALHTTHYTTHNHTYTVTSVTKTEPLGIRSHDRVTGVTITESANASWGFN